MTSHLRPFAFLLAAPLTLSALSGCFHDSNDDPPAANNPPPPPPPAALSETQIDATAGGLGVPSGDPRNKYTYFNLGTGKVVDLTDAAAAVSSAWHIAFKRSSIILNGGASGSGPVKGALADDQYSDGFYINNDDTKPNASVFLSATKEREKEDFDAVTRTQADALSYQADRRIPAIRGDGGADGWWLYDPATRNVSANAGNWWLVRSAGGDSYARLRVTGIVRTETNRNISLEMFVQGVGQSAFPSAAVTATLSLPLAGGARCYDFDARAEADCAGAAWDLKAEYDATTRAYNLWTNGGVSTTTGGKGAAFGRITQADIGGYGSGTLGPSGMNIAGLYTPDKAGGVFTDKSWYAYNLQQNDHKLWPNFRVYAVDTGSVKYKLQILSYYDAGGASGWITLRHQPLK